MLNFKKILIVSGTPIWVIFQNSVTYVCTLLGLTKNHERLLCTTTVLHDIQAYVIICKCGKHKMYFGGVSGV